MIFDGNTIKTYFTTQVKCPKCSGTIEVMGYIRKTNFYDDCGGNKIEIEKQNNNCKPGCTCPKTWYWIGDSVMNTKEFKRAYSQFLKNIEKEVIKI